MQFQRPNTNPPERGQKLNWFRPLGSQSEWQWSRASISIKKLRLTEIMCPLKSRIPIRCPKKMHHKIEIHPKLCMRSLKSRIPRRWDKYHFLQASIFQQQPNGIQFCPKQLHFSRSPNRKDALPNWDPPKIYTCVRWNPVSQTDAQNTVFFEQLYFSRSPNRKDAL